jgi:hypothetical protein
MVSGITTSADNQNFQGSSQKQSGNIRNTVSTTHGGQYAQSSVNTSTGQNAESSASSRAGGGRVNADKNMLIAQPDTNKTSNFSLRQSVVSKKSRSKISSQSKTHQPPQVQTTSQFNQMLADQLNQHQQQQD